ncbi:MAG TPA: hypothetical protein VE263_16385 [Candidatus Angelobacter sp.]|nr:hypothetical protein [Candidatus Angelobacter sp.]
MRTILFVTVTILLLACGRIGAQHQETNSTDVITKMTQESKQGHYEQAIQIGLNALENKPSDDAILRQVAIINLMRAEKDRERADQWVKQAITSADKSVAINPVVDIGRYEAARIYEHSGDLAKENKCSLYGQALKTLAEWSSTLKGESITVEGKDFPVAPLRKEADATKARIEGKQAQSHCE